MGEAGRAAEKAHTLSSPLHGRVIRNKNLAYDDSEGVRDRPREGLSLQSVAGIKKTGH